MPSDLFGDISHRRPTTRFGRRTVVLTTVVAHTLVFTGALFFSLSSAGLLPEPRTALAFVDTARRVQLVDVQLPSTPRAAAQASHDAAVIEHVDTPAAPDDAAPVVAPNGIAPDSDAVRPPVRPSDRPTIDVRAGVGDELRGVARTEAVRPPAAAPQTPIRLHSGILHPVKRVDVSPTYPPLAQSARVQGVVILEAVVDATGQVTSVQVLRSIPLLDQAAINAVRQWRYTPAMLNGSPVPVIMTVTVNFTL